MNDVLPILTITSDVVRGLGMGKKLGFPTINLVHPEHAEFADGVYVCKVVFPEREYFGVMHHGPRPTIDKESSLEVHLLDYSGGDLYGQHCEVSVLHRLRGVAKFESPKALVEQIERDISMARAYLNHEENESTL